jgi:glycosyltransferase involved in cell wall biosynthesis
MSSVIQQEEDVQIPVPELLGAFDVYAISSLWEGLPCAVVEAMTCGIPVVATAVNSVRNKGEELLAPYEPDAQLPL